MGKPNAKLRKSLERATAAYETSLPLALSYLAGRGVTEATAKQYRLGVVDSPEPGHEPNIGRIAIPYIDKLGVYGLKFRCMVGHDCKAEKCPKFTSLPGFEVSVYNILTTDALSDTIHICEGEPDAWIISQVFGAPVVGVPGATNWKDHWRYHFSGFDRVVMWPDGDKAGADLANRVKKSVRHVEFMPVPEGEDVGSLFLGRGEEFLWALFGDEREEND